MGGITSLRILSISIDDSVGTRMSIKTILLLSSTATLALSTGINHTANSYSVTNSILCEFQTNLGDNSSVSWNGRILDWPSIPTGSMDVSVANTRILDLNENIMRLKIPALNCRTSWTEHSTCISINHI